MPTAVKIADNFNCSLDYLFGRTDDYKNSDHTECPPFSVQFRKVLAEQKVSQYRLIKDKVISGGNIDSWLNNKQTPHMESVINLQTILKLHLITL